MLKTSSSGQGSQDGQSALASLEKRLTGRNPDDSDVPAPVRKAVRFMLGGALVTVVAGIFTVIATVADPRLINNGKQPTSSQLSSDLVQVAVLTLVYAALWVVMARTNRSGAGWARYVASALFAISTYSLYAAVNSLHTGQYLAVVNIISFVLAVAEWVCGLGAVALLWRSESSVYIKARASRR